MSDHRSDNQLMSPQFPPAAQGLYDPRFEHDACGNIKGRKSHAVVERGLQVLINLQHRGACGREANTGDGAGILIQPPDKFLRRVTGALGIGLPPAGGLSLGIPPGIGLASPP